VALIFAEDDVEIRSTIAHHLLRGFKSVLVFIPSPIAAPENLPSDVKIIQYNTLANGAVPQAINVVINAAPDIWVYYCYNAEYLFYPFCEPRNIGELLEFNTSEDRNAMMIFVIDLYAADLTTTPNAVSLVDAMIDATGYYALARTDPDNHNSPKERQLNFYGGLRWRFKQYAPKTQRRIDRVALFLCKRRPQLQTDEAFNNPEYNTYTGAWHNSPSAAILSFGAAKALQVNAPNRFAHKGFQWPGYAPFEWRSEQLLQLGLIEAGQWF
jgi:hypothetical protein